MYYKVGADSELPEWHGNLYLETEGLNASDKAVTLGFLVGGDNDGTYGWDGIDCKVSFNPSALEEGDYTFSGVDVYHEGSEVPNYFDQSKQPYYGNLSVTTQNDASQDWKVVASKSFITCEDPYTGACKINMHFMRLSETEDAAKDHQINQLEGSSTFKGSMWYTLSQNNQVTNRGQSSEFEIITMDASETAEDFAVSQISSFSAVMLALIVSQMF